MARCRKYEETQICVGDRARIIIGKNKYAGTLVSIGERMTPTMPKFRLDDGRIVWGYECWWVPLSKAMEIEAGRKLAGE